VRVLEPRRRHVVERLRFLLEAQLLAADDPGAGEHRGELDGGYRCRMPTMVSYATLSPSTAINDSAALGSPP
jgi:hypothetical protein